MNKARVDVGTSPPIDLVSAQAELASNEEQLIIAETAVKEAEDRLRVLILDTTQRDAWTVALDAVDSPPVGLGAPDTDAAIATALRERTDLVRARKDIETAQTTLKFTDNQRLPDVRLNASYAANGLGGTQVLRDGSTFPGTIIGSGVVTPFGSVLGQLFGRDYPTWNVGVSVSYPIGQSAEEANHARARLESAQTQERLKSAEAKVIQQVRDAGWKIGMNARRVQTSRAGARARRTAVRRGAEAARRRPVDEFPGDSGAAGSRAGARPTNCPRSWPTTWRSWISTRCSWRRPRGGDVIAGDLDDAARRPPRRVERCRRRPRGTCAFGIAPRPCDPGAARCVYHARRPCDWRGGSD